MLVRKQKRCQRTDEYQPLRRDRRGKAESCHCVVLIRYCEGANQFPHADCFMPAVQSLNSPPLRGVTSNIRYPAAFVLRLVHVHQQVLRVSIHEEPLPRCCEALRVRSN